MNPKLFLAAIAAVGVFAIAYESLKSSQPAQDPVAESGPLVKVIVPVFSARAQVGQLAFEEHCASCHGRNAAGKNGLTPPLVHKIYEPGHHSDVSFQLAVKNGVRAHHWRFGNMPPIQGVSEEKVSDITLYVRELQQANGIN